MRGGIRIAVLLHGRDRHREISRYMIASYAETWREMGHEVVWVYGTRKREPADLAIVHVDLSVVPDEYLELAREYPLAINGTVHDIRKSTFSQQLLHRDSPYSGPVIVKSNLNHGGRPEERRERRLARWLRGAMGRRASIARPSDYRVYESLAQVPEPLFDDPQVVVEKFLPERTNGLFHVRIYQFLGERSTCSRLASRSEVVRSSSYARVEDVGVHGEIVEQRRKLGFDFGKFDYVVHDGRPVLLDVNKTPSAPSNLARSPERLARWRGRAEGLLDFLER